MRPVGVPTMTTYRLTDKGRDLWPVITATRQLGDRHVAPGGPPITVIHKSCGAVCDGVMVCASCGETVGPRDIVAVASPGHERTALIS